MIDATKITVVVREFNYFLVCVTVDDVLCVNFFCVDFVLVKHFSCSLL